MNNLLRRCRHVHPDSLPGHVVRLAPPQRAAAAAAADDRRAGDLPGGGGGGEDGSLGVSGAAGRRRNQPVPRKF